MKGRDEREAGGTTLLARLRSLPALAHGFAVFVDLGQMSRVDRVNEGSRFVTSGCGEQSGPAQWVPGEKC